MAEPYNSFNAFLRKKFKSKKVLKIPINAGFTCPNKNGKLSNRGCIFCDTYGSGPIKRYDSSIKEQIRRFILDRRHRQFKYIAYYQAHSNTYGRVEELRKKYQIIFNFPEIVGLFIGTRPDTIAPGVYPLLEELNERTYMTIELGLQSIHNKSLRYLNRNHTYEKFCETFFQLKKRNIDVVVHLIIGIPGESESDMLATVQELNRLHPAGIKFHLMHVLRDTPLYDMYREEKFKLLGKNEYVSLMAKLLEHLDPSIVIHRLTGERDKEIFYAPGWALEKNNVIQTIRKTMIDRKTFQGRLLKP